MSCFFSENSFGLGKAFLLQVVRHLFVIQMVSIRYIVGVSYAFEGDKYKGKPTTSKLSL